MLPAVCLALLLADQDRPLEPVATLGQSTMVCHDYGRIFATPDGKRAVTARGEWFDLEAGRPINPPFPLPDGSRVHSMLDDGTVVVESAKHLLFFPPGTTKPKRTLETLGRRVWLTNDGRGAVSLQGWTDDTVSLLVADKDGSWKSVADRLPPVKRLTLNTTGTHAAVLFGGYGDVAVIDLTTKKQTLFLEKRPKPRPPTGEFAFECFGLDRRTEVALSPDGKVVYIDRDGSVTAYDSDVELNDKSFEARWWLGMPLAHVEIVRQFERRELAWIGDGSKQVRVTDGGVLRVFDTITGKQIDKHSTYQGFYGVKAIDDRRAITWTVEGRVVTWDTGTGKPIAEVQLEREDKPVGGFFPDVRPSADGNRILIVRRIGAVDHFDARTGKSLLDEGETPLMFDAEDRPLVDRDSTLREAGGGRVHATSPSLINSVLGDHPPHFDPSGRLALFPSLGGVTLVEWGTGRIRCELSFPSNFDTLDYLVQSGTRNYLVQSVACGRHLVLVRNLDVVVYDLPAQKLIRRFPLEPGEWKSAAISADGNWLVVASARTYLGAATFTLFPLDHPNPLAAAVELPIRPSTYTTGVAFTPDGKRLLTSHAGGMAHAWDISRFTSPETNPRAAVLWDGLGSEEEKVVGEVMAEMAQTPQVTVRLLARRLTPIPRLDEKAVKARIIELGSSDFRTREATTTALEAMDERAVPLLKAAAEANPVPEVADRLNRIRAAIESREPPPEWARQLRAVELLENIGGRDAERVLASLAGGAPGARLTMEAEQTLRRMRAKK